ncbi:MAG: STAS domain-containing protein [Methylococcales bacterium]|nr:STAS domain-containing protein [Methylococcales bacterium]MBT7409307.1 STAS domain-containing protein [Methylococcales bacterium]
MSNLEYDCSEGECTISVNGTFNALLLGTWNELVQKDKNEINRIQIDFSDCEEIDNSGLALLFILKEKMGGDESRIELINVNEEIKRAFAVAEFHQLFHIV